MFWLFFKYLGVFDIEMLFIFIAAIRLFLRIVFRITLTLKFLNFIQILSNIILLFGYILELYIRQFSLIKS